MIVDMLSNKKFNPIVMELFIWGFTLLLFLLGSFILMYQETKFYILSYYESSKQTRASTNRI